MRARRSRLQQRERRNTATKLQETEAKGAIEAPVLMVGVGRNSRKRYRISKSRQLGKSPNLGIAVCSSPIKAFSIFAFPPPKHSSPSPTVFPVPIYLSSPPGALSFSCAIS